MPSDETEKTSRLAHALLAYVDGSRLYAKGAFWQDSKLQNKGLDICHGAAVTIETLTGSRDLLLPLLEHDEPAARLNACLMLIDDHYDRVIPVLQDLNINCVTEMSGLAGIALQMYGEPNLGNKFTKVEPSMTPQPGRRLTPRSRK